MKKLILVLAIILPSLFMLAPVASAFDILPNSGACKNSNSSAACSVCTQAPNSAVCQDANNGSGYAVSGKGSLILSVTRLIAIAAGIAAVIMIIVSGFQFIFSGGEAEKAAGARRTLLYSVVGLVIIVLAEVIIEFVVSHV